MNLSIDPWIPVMIGRNGARSPALVSLGDVFSDDGGIIDLQCRADQRIALTRLLLCVAHAAGVDGPQDPALKEKALAYLSKWQDRFNLLDEKMPFLQVPGLAWTEGREGAVRLQKLDLSFSGENAAQVFRKDGERTFTQAQAALLLLSYQALSPGGTIGTAKWGGIPTEKHSCASPGLSNKPVHAFLIGSDLISTIRLNILPADSVGMPMGRPVWEQFPENIADKAAVENATTTYLGNLVPLSRAMLLNPNLQTLILADALSTKYPGYPGIRDPFFTLIPDKKSPTGKQTLSVNPNRAIWRELDSLLAFRRESGAMVLRNATSAEAFDLWVGGVETAKGKIDQILESRFHVPAGLLNDSELTAYRASIDTANKRADMLRTAVWVYRQILNDKEGASKVAGAAMNQFWFEMEPEAGILLAKPEGWSQAWDKTVRQNAREAFKRACPTSDTKRLRAHLKAAKQFSD